MLSQADATCTGRSRPNQRLSFLPDSGGEGGGGLLSRPFRVFVRINRIFLLMVFSIVDAPRSEDGTVSTGATFSQSDLVIPRT